MKRYLVNAPSQLVVKALQSMGFKAEVSNGYYVRTNANGSWVALAIERSERLA